MTAHIGRLQAIGLGKESTPGTPVSATVWIPKIQAEFMPEFEKATDDSAYGVIDEIYDTQTVKNMTKVSVNGIVRDNWIGNMFMATMGDHTLCKFITILNFAAGTPARGDTISSVAGSWAGTIRKVLIISAVTYYLVEITSGTYSDVTDVTNGTWTGGDSVEKTTVKAHLFTRLNTNSHPSYTFYGSDPVGDEYSAYVMMDSFEMELGSGDYVKFTSAWQGKQLVTASAQSPAYSSDNVFLAKHAEVYFGDAEDDLNAATASTVERFKFSVAKNLEAVQALGSDDVDSFHNKQFGVTGDLEGLYSDTVFREYVADSTKKAARVALINTAATALVTGVYPSIFVDFMRFSFTEWSRSSDNNGLVRQTMGFTGEYSNNESATMEIVLLNSNASSY